MDSASLRSTRQRQSDLQDQIHRELVNRSFQFNKRSQLVIGMDNEAVSVIPGYEITTSSPSSVTTIGNGKNA
ncbi:MAG: hypothetical protein ACREFF_15450 [Candidatus Udaeobacter sp.]